MDSTILEVFSNRNDSKAGTANPAFFPSAPSRLSASCSSSSAQAHAGVRAGRGHARARPREAARASGRDRHLCGSGADRTPPFAALRFESGAPPPRREKGTERVRAGPRRVAAKRSGRAPPPRRRVPPRGVRAGPGGAPSSAGCAPPLPWRGEAAAAAGGGDCAPRPPMRLWPCWLGCYTLLLWALRRRMWAGPARYLRSPLSRSLYANMMGSHGPPAPGAGENHQVRPSGLRLPCPAFPAPPLPLLAPAGPCRSGAAPREATGGGRAARGTGGGERPCAGRGAAGPGETKSGGGRVLLPRKLTCAPRVRGGRREGKGGQREPCRRPGAAAAR